MDAGGDDGASLASAARQHWQAAELGVVQVLDGRLGGALVGVDDVAGMRGHGASRLSFVD